MYPEEKITKYWELAVYFPQINKNPRFHCNCTICVILVIKFINKTLQLVGTQTCAWNVLRTVTSSIIQRSLKGEINHLTSQERPSGHSILRIVT